MGRQFFSLVIIILFEVAKEIGYLQAKEYHDAYKVVDKIYNDNDDRAAYNRQVVRILRNMIY